MKNSQINETTIILGILLSIAIIGLFLSNFNSGFGMPCRDYGQYGSYLTYGFGWTGLFMLIIWALVLVLLILGVIWLLKQIKK